MQQSAGYTPFHYDARGNRLERWTSVITQSGHILLLRGPLEVVRQVQAVAPEYQELELPASRTNEWTHALSSPDRAVKREVQVLLELLCEIISLPSLPMISFAVALDWYKIPLDGVDPYQWPNTGAGELVYSGKYRYWNLEEPQATAGLALAGRICNALNRHTALRSAAIVLDVPGHDSTRVSFGSRLAATVARDMGVPKYRVGTRSAFRPEAKNLSPAAQAEVLDNQFIVPTEVRGYPVLIVDDVFKTGGSMSSVGKAAYKAGARAVFGICAARTMRR